MTTIRAATYWRAVAMRKGREVGTISRGQSADITGVRGDVLRYINLLQRADIVVKRGTHSKSPAGCGRATIRPPVGSAGD